MGYYATDTNLSLETRGAVAAVLAHGQTTFTVQDIRDVGASKATAYRILGELRANGYVQKGGGHTWQWLKSYRVSGNPEIRKTGKSDIHIDHDLRESESMSVASRFPENEHDFNHSSDDGPELPEAPPEFTQPPLLALPEPPTPISAAPPSPEKPKRDRKASARSPEDIACDEALAALCGVNLQALDREHRLGLMSKRKSLQKAGATPERLAAMGEWWRKHSPIAQVRAKRQEGPPSPPTLTQVGQFYQQAQEWHDARVAAEAREQQRQADAQARRLPDPDDVERARAIARRGFLGLGPATPRPALTARGRAT